MKVEKYICDITNCDREVNEARGKGLDVHIVIIVDDKRGNNRLQSHKIDLCDSCLHKIANRDGILKAAYYGTHRKLLIQDGK